MLPQTQRTLTTKSVDYSENMHSYCFLSIVNAASYEFKSERGFAA